MSVAVAITTYCRPRLLSNLLQSLYAQELDPELGSSVLVVVVDNDEAESARPVVEAAAADFPWKIEYAVEPVRNISLARNRGVHTALRLGALHVAFIDDDEQAAPGWLRELVRVQAACAADVVWGRVVPSLPEDAPGWISGGGFFDRGRHATGTPVTVAETANALVSARILTRLEGPFDPAFGISGGGDSHFFRRAVAAGAVMVWADDAVVVETVPPNRANAGWILKRAFRVGNHTVCVERAITPPTRWLPPRVMKATGRVAVGVAMMLAVPLRGRVGLVAALRNVMLGFGAYSGILGFRYIAYRKVDGS